MDASDTTTVRPMGVDLDWLPEGDREDAWRRTVGSGFEVYDLPDVLKASAKAWDLGQSLLTDATHPHQTFIRDRARARRDGEEHVRISVELTQSSWLGFAGQEVEVAPRQVHLFDMTQPLDKRVGGGRVLCLAVAREAVEAALPGVDVHGLTLGPSGALLAEHLRALRESLEGGATLAAGPLTTATLQLVAACVAPTASRVDAARSLLGDALLRRARRYIRARCEDVHLAPDEVARAVGASRASLYRAFEAEGGVASFIRRSRLEAARAALLNPADQRRIGEIAFGYGFSSEAQFSRAFRAAFDAAPRDVREGGAPTRAAGRLDRYWFLNPLAEAA